MNDYRANEQLQEPTVREVLPTLHPLRAGEAPRYRGLHLDTRGKVIGAQGVVLVVGARRLLTLLVALSQRIELSRGVAVETYTNDRALITLTTSAAGTDLARLYAHVQAAVTLVGSAHVRLFVGDGSAFVPYTDPTAPYGFDLRGVAPTHGRVLLMPDQALRLPAPQPNRLLETLLRIPLQPTVTPPPTRLTLLTDRRLAALVASYLQRHGLTYAVRLLTWPHGPQPREVALIDTINPDDAHPVPHFVGHFLSQLPQSTLLADALAPGDRAHEPPQRVLVPWGYRSPLDLAQISDLLPARCLLIFGGEPWGTGMITEPPVHTTMTQITTIDIGTPVQLTTSTRPAQPIRIPLALHPSDTADTPVHGLLLDPSAIVRLQRIMRHLPAAFFANTRIAVGAGVAVIIATAGREVRGLPIGLPLTRVGTLGLLVPRGMALQPRLPADLLSTVLELHAEELTVITTSGRYVVAYAAFQPLTSLLARDLPTTLGHITVEPVQLPPLDLHDLLESPTAETLTTATGEPPPPVRTEPKQPPFIKRFLGQTIGVRASFTEELRQCAHTLEQGGNDELAAAFYTYVQEPVRAAACYERLAKKR